jgi:hypothetical protein
MDESSLPTPFRIALEHLREKKQAETHVDAVCNNFAYVWVSNLQKANAGAPPGGWIRLPTAFPFGNPHGLVTTEPLKREDGSPVTDAHHPNHDMCKPVQSLGGANYYSWTWQDCPPLQDPRDIVGVLQWYERRIRRG